MEIREFLDARGGSPFASWFDDLRPAFGERRFFFQDEPLTAPELIPVLLETA